MKNTSQDLSIFKNIFESSNTAMIIVRNDGKIYLANAAAYNLFCCKTSELEDKNIDELLSNEWKKRVQDEIANDSNVTQNFDISGITKMGDAIHLTISISKTSAVENTTSLITFASSSQHELDLSVIKNTNVKLAESNRKFDSLINNLKGIAFRCKNNKNFDMDFISEGCLEITGYDSKAFKNQKINFGNLILEEDREHVWETIQMAIIHKRQYDFEYRIRHKDGSIKYVWEKGEAIDNDNQLAEMLEGFISDITPLKESTLRLNQSEAKIKALLQAIPDTIIVQDRDGNYLDWYDNSADNLLVTPIKRIGSNMEATLPKSVYHKIKKSHSKLIETGEMQIADYSFSTTKGDVHHEARVVLMSDDRLLTIIRDVTEKKELDSLLNIRNNALESTINSIVIVDAQNPNVPIIYCNQAFENMTGYTSQEIIGMKCPFLKHDNRDQKQMGELLTSIKSGTACNAIVRNYKKDGSIFWNDITVTPVRNDDNKLTHFISVQNDITEKIKAENLKEQIKKALELIAKDKPLKTVGNKIVEIIETHIDNCMVSILLFNSERDKLHDLVTPDVPSFFSNYIENPAIISELFFSENPFFSEKMVIVPNISQHESLKHYKDVALKNGVTACWSFPIMSSAKEILGVIAIFSKVPREPSFWEIEIIMDMIDLISILVEKENTSKILHDSKIQLENYAQELEHRVQERTQEVMATVQKLVETNFNLEDQIIKAQKAENLAKSSSRIASEIAKNFPNGFVSVIDKDLKILFAEGEGLAQLGLEKFLHEGMRIDDILNLDEDRKMLLKNDVVKTLTGERLAYEINYEDRYFAVNTVPLIDEDNQINTSLHVYSDISQQKEVEFSIKEALNKERELNSLKSRFISMASHEFRTPLSAIQTSAILIGRQNELEDKSKREKYVAQIEKNVNHLTQILNDFLSISKLEEGKLEKHIERFDVIAFAKLFLKESFIGLKREQTLILNTDTDSVIASLDRKLLTHILNNLLSNASKYSPAGSAIDLNIIQSENNVSFEISDSGIGIPNEEQQYLFSRFFRAKNAVNIEGTGLGLNIVKHYTELMGGRVTFDSEVNKGATFIVSFPKK